MGSWVRRPFYREVTEVQGHWWSSRGHTRVRKRAARTGPQASCPPRFSVFLGPRPFSLHSRLGIKAQ